jgi:glutathione S-transferase
VILSQRLILTSVHADKVTGMSFMEQATLFGAAYSVYVRIARLVMEEACMPYDLVEIDVFSKDDLPADYAARHPFGKIPAFEHDGYRLFETDAIAQYVIGVSGNQD